MRRPSARRSAGRRLAAAACAACAVAGLIAVAVAATQLAREHPAARDFGVTSVTCRPSAQHRVSAGAPQPATGAGARDARSPGTDRDPGPEGHCGDRGRHQRRRRVGRAGRPDDRRLVDRGGPARIPLGFGRSRRPRRLGQPRPRRILRAHHVARRRCRHGDDRSRRPRRPTWSPRGARTRKPRACPRTCSPPVGRPGSC